MNFDIHIKYTPDTVILSYNQETMESLPKEIAADLLHILKEKHLSSNLFFEFEPAIFANQLLTRTVRHQFNENHSPEFNIFKEQVISSILLNANTDENDFYKILETLYKYEDVISQTKVHDEPIQYRVNNFEVSFKDLSITKQLSPQLAQDFPSYLLDLLNHEYAIRNQEPLPAKRIFSLSTETKHYLYDNFQEKVNESSPEPFSYLTFFVKCHIHTTCKNVNDIFNTLKIIDSINQELEKDNQIKPKKNRP